MNKILISTLTIFAMVSFGENLDKTASTSSGITVHIPSDWQQIPADVLSECLAETSAQNPNLPEYIYECGFQAPADSWFSYPYILIHIQHGERIPSADLEKLPNLNQLMSKRMEEISESASTFSDAVMDTTVYDSEQHILWASARANYDGIGKVKMLGGSHLSEVGLVQAFGYALEDDFEKHEALLRKIISNIELPENMRYTPRVTDDLPLLRSLDWDKIISNSLSVAILGVIIAVFSSMKKKNKNSQPPS